MKYSPIDAFAQAKNGDFNAGQGCGFLIESALQANIERIIINAKIARVDLLRGAGNGAGMQQFGLLISVNQCKLPLFFMAGI